MACARKSNTCERVDLPANPGIQIGGRPPFDRDVLGLCQYRFAGELAQEITYPKLSFDVSPMSVASFLAEPIVRKFPYECPRIRNFQIPRL